MKLSKISFTGDLLCYQDMTESCKTETGYDYSPIFENVKKELAASDYAVGNLETPVAGSELGYTYERYRFNTPCEYLEALKNAGIDAVCLANNHCMDRGEQGLINTLAACREKGLDCCGVHDSKESSERILIKNINGIRVAVINYTYGSNAFAHHTFLQSGHEYMVKMIQPEETRDFAIDLLASNENIKNNMDRLYSGDGVPLEKTLCSYHKQIENDIKCAKNNADTVIFCLHSGGQYNTHHDPYTQMMIEKIYGMGADLVVGLHPHIIQPCEWKNGFPLIYCLGNAVYSLKTVTTESEIEKSYNVILHAYIDGKAKEITKLTFSLMKNVDNNGNTVSVNTCDLCDSNPQLAGEVLEMAGYFSGNAKYDKLCREYPLYQRNTD